MSRVFLIHWHAEEAKQRVAKLRSAGHTVGCHSDEGKSSAKRIKDFAPDALVIDLSRLQAHGRQIATWLRETKATRHVPIVFVDGPGEKVARIREAFPDAVYSTWSRIKSAVKTAIASPPKAPVVATAGYSGTPLPKKLGIKPDSVVALAGAPKQFELGELPDGVSVRTRLTGKADVIVLFVDRESELARRWATAERALADGGGLWIAWPKQASGVATDVTEDVVRTIGLASGLVDNKICAIDQTWSGLRFVRRRKPR